MSSNQHIHSQNPLKSYSLLVDLGQIDCSLAQVASELNNVLDCKDERKPCVFVYIICDSQVIVIKYDGRAMRRNLVGVLDHFKTSILNYLKGECAGGIIKGDLGYFFQC